MNILISEECYHPLPIKAEESRSKYLAGSHSIIPEYKKAICAPHLLNLFFWEVSICTFLGQSLDIIKSRVEGKIETLIEFGYV